MAPPFRQMYMGFQGGEPLDPLPGYVPAFERPETNPAQAVRFPLNIVSPKSHGFLNSQYANERHKIARQGEQAILINPADALGRSIADGAMVSVFNDRGDLSRQRHIDRGRAARRGGGLARLLARAEQGRRGQRDQFVGLRRHGPLADLLGQSGGGAAGGVADAIALPPPPNASFMVA